MDIYITIHATSEWNEKKLSQGHCDTHLSTSGRRMAELLGQRDDLSCIRQIISSDLARARETAQPLADRLGIEIIQDPDLREGRWAHHHQDASVPLLPFHGSFETHDDLKSRAARTLRRIAENATVSPLLIVTHGAFLRHFFQSLGEPAAPYKGTRTALHRIRYEHGQWKIVSLNDDAHLSAFDKPVNQDAG